jgi:death-on-curing family protein
MPKIKRRVHQLAKTIGCTAEQALETLTAAGIRANSIHDLISESSVGRALRILRGEEAPSSPRPPEVSLENGVASSITTLQPQPNQSIDNDNQSTLSLLSPKKRKEKGPRSRSVHRLSEDDVLAIRRRMASMLIAEKDAFGASKPLWPDRLSMAVQRQFTSAGGVFKYKTVPEVGATLTFGIAMNHAFENGNKRTALVSLLILLNRNKTILVDTSQDDLYSLITSLVKHELALLDGSKRNSESEAPEKRP